MCVLPSGSFVQVDLRVTLFLSLDVLHFEVFGSVSVHFDRMEGDITSSVPQASVVFCCDWSVEFTSIRVLGQGHFRILLTLFSITFSNH